MTVLTYKYQIQTPKTEKGGLKKKGKQWGNQLRAELVENLITVSDTKRRIK